MRRNLDKSNFPFFYYCYITCSFWVQNHSTQSAGRNRKVLWWRHWHKTQFAFPRFRVYVSALCEHSFMFNHYYEAQNTIRSFAWIYIYIPHTSSLVNLAQTNIRRTSFHFFVICDNTIYVWKRKVKLRYTNNVGSLPPCLETYTQRITFLSHSHHRLVHRQRDVSSRHACRNSPSASLRSG